MLVAPAKNAMQHRVCCNCLLFLQTVIANVQTARQSRHCCEISVEAFNVTLEPSHGRPGGKLVTFQQQQQQQQSNNKQLALDP